MPDRAQSAGEILALTVLIPVYDDWEAVEQLLRNLDRTVARLPVRAGVLIVDDASVARAEPGRLTGYRNLEGVDILHLRRNLGHQRAIAIGLFHIYERRQAGAVLIMDGDGEDRPEDIAALLAEFGRLGGERIVFAARTKRMESLPFRVSYALYRWTHRALTGIPVRVGNFSLLPRQALERLMVVSELWNHYAAAVFRAKLPFSEVPLPKGRRYAGESRMNFFALLVHGLSAIVTFGDLVSVRMLAISIGMLALTAALVAPALWVSRGPVGGTAGAGAMGGGAAAWPILGLGILLALVAQAAMFATLMAFVTVGSRSGMTFLPLRDAGYFRASVTRVFRLREEAGVEGVGAAEGMIAEAGREALPLSASMRELSQRLHA